MPYLFSHQIFITGLLQVPPTRKICYIIWFHRITQIIDFKRRTPLVAEVFILPKVTFKFSCFPALNLNIRLLKQIIHQLDFVFVENYTHSKTSIRSVLFVFLLQLNFVLPCNRAQQAAKQQWVHHTVHSPIIVLCCSVPFYLFSGEQLLPFIFPGPTDCWLFLHMHCS